MNEPINILTNAERCAYLKTIQQLEKENREDRAEWIEKVDVLKAKLTANRFIFRTTVRNEYLDKIEDLELQRDGQSITIGQQAKTIENLKRTIEIQIADSYKLVQDTAKIIADLKLKLASIKTLNGLELEEILNLKEQLRISILCNQISAKNYTETADEVYKLNSKLANIKTLNREEVMNKVKEFKKDYLDGSYIADTNFLGLVTAICNLAVKANKGVIIRALDDFKYHFIPENYDKLATEIIKELGGK